MEKVYSTITTPDNFTMFGGLLLANILSGILGNQMIIDLFSDLFADDQFSEDTMGTSMTYYVKVFGNVRAKDI